MSKTKAKTILRRRASRLTQNDKYPLYQFSLTAEELLLIADISRVSRDSTGKLIGYQRPEVKRHVNDIVDYLNGPNVLFPNSIILALSPRVKFIRSRGPQVAGDNSVMGILEIPVPHGTEQKPGWIVDGQQRALALSMSTKGKLPIPINAFPATNIELQRDQFLRVNNTKPLPRGLITELLPEVSTPLPATLAAKKIPSELCNLLNTVEQSPFKGLIKRSSTPKEQRKRAIITDTSIVKMIQESLTSPQGCLFPHRNIATGETDFDTIWHILTTYWTAVSLTFPDAWGLPPATSRLMHGAGIVSMGRLMDKIMPHIRLNEKNALKKTRGELARVAPMCRWTSGSWAELGGLEWNEVQNVPRHVRNLSSVLIQTYVRGEVVAA